jgi:tetratricopeptide (TPR) repeat protein
LSAAHRDLAGVLAGQKRYDEAVAQYRLAADLAPSDAAIPMKLAETLKSAGDLPGAALAYQRAADLDPAGFGPRFELAKVYYDLGKFAEALAALESARRAAPHLEPLDLADYHYGVGAVLYATPGREKEAAVHFLEALRLNPDANQAAEVREALSSMGIAAPPAPAAPPAAPPDPLRP